MMKIIIVNSNRTGVYNEILTSRSQLECAHELNKHMANIRDLQTRGNHAVGTWSKRMSTDVHRYICMYARMHAWSHIWMHLHIYVLLFVCTYVFICMYICSTFYSLHFIMIQSLHRVEV